jgi:predicted transcriptional regulator
MAERRPMGALTDEIMNYLWAIDGPATPSEVHEAVAPELAYTTVMTILTRQWQKNELTRTRSGRAYAYEPVRTEAEDRAGRMQLTLGKAGDRAAVLSSFVDSLDPKDAKVLKKLLAPGR